MLSWQQLQRTLCLIPGGMFQNPTKQDLIYLDGEPHDEQPPLQKCKHYRNVNRAIKDTSLNVYFNAEKSDIQFQKIFQGFLYAVVHSL